MMSVLISVDSRFIKFRRRHVSWKIVHDRRVVGVTTAAAWVGIWIDFGKLSMGSILSCGVPRALKCFWYTTYKLETAGAAASQELSVKDRKIYKESLSTGRFIPHKDPLCFI